MDGIVPGAQGDGRAGDEEAVVYMNGIRRGGDGDLAAGDAQAVVCGNAVLIGGGDGEGAGAVDGQIVVGEDGTVGLVRQGSLAVSLAGGDGVFRALRQGQEYLIRLIDPDGGIVGAGDGDAV